MRRAGLAEVREIALRAPRPPLEVPVTRAMCDLEYSFITDKEKLATCFAFNLFGESGDDLLFRSVKAEGRNVEDFWVGEQRSNRIIVMALQVLIS
jgi:hypothetical protein